MSPEKSINPEIEKLFKKLDDDAEKSGYHLNPDYDFTMALAEGLVKNTKRYGYQACPCRLAAGVREQDRDIICPCDYRDSDLDEFDACYCGLYVSSKIVSGEKKLKSIPERRASDPKKRSSDSSSGSSYDGLPYPVWRCKVCGYLCAREEPPATCPICKVDKDRFERFL
jgi:ferredoxin-thioredoxin reductase catalytic subunit